MTSQIAVQLYTLRDETAQDFVGTLKAVAQLGYAGVEFAGYGSMAARELKTVLADLGLKAAGAHVPLESLETELDQVIAYNLEIGNRYIACPWLAPARRQNYRQVAQTLVTVGRRLREHGLELLYHNHDFEFERVDGQYALDLLLEADPTAVGAELDVYWVHRAGEDPAAYLRRLHGRCPLVHLKDMAPGDDRRFAPVGTGVIDFAAIFAAAQESTQWFIVEQDQTYGQPPLEAVRTSLENLRAWGRA